MAQPPGAEPDLRLAELLATLSLATDLGLGVPLETSLRTCLLSVRLGEAVGLTGQDLSDVYYAALLHTLGCTSFSHEESAQIGDEVQLHAMVGRLDGSRPLALMATVVRHLGEGRGGAARAQALGGLLTAGPTFLTRLVTAHCEAGTRLATQLGLSSGVITAIGSTLEFWNGKGGPSGLAGERIPLATRLVQVGHNVAFTMRSEEPRRMLRRRAGRVLDPDLVDAFLGKADELLEPVTQESVWEMVLEAEPQPRPWIPPSRVPGLARAFADFAHLQSVFTVGHSTNVAELAQVAATGIGPGYCPGHPRPAGSTDA